MVFANVNAMKAIVIIGATASGKSALAHWLCDWLQYEKQQSSRLINLDAFQIYKGFDIGSAKPTVAEHKQYSYSMIDVIEPDDGLDARQFAEMAIAACNACFAAGQVPICVGGSGLYLRAFLHGLDNFPERNDALRRFIREYAKHWGWPKLHTWLATLDAERASELHPNDKTRIERALEIIWLTGKKVSSSRSQTTILKQQSERFENFVIHVDGSDNFLKERVLKRTAALFDAGWIEEVSALYRQYGDKISEFPALRAIGYKEILSFLSQNQTATDLKSLEALKNEIATKTWQYARRQRTWNAKEKCDATFSWETDDSPSLLFANLFS